MSNLEREMKLKMLDDEELEFQSPIMDDEEDFDVIPEEDFIIEKPIEKEASKSPKKENKAQSPAKDKKMAGKGSDEVSAAKNNDKNTERKHKKKQIVEEAKEETPYMEGSEPPIIQIIPAEEPKEDSFEQIVREMQSTTEEFDYIEDAPQEPIEETLKGEVEGEGRADTIEFTDEDRKTQRSFADVKPSNIKSFPTFPRFNISDTAKQIGSLVAVFALFVICFKSYGYYIDKKMTPINDKKVTMVAESIKENASEKTSEMLEPYKIQAEEEREKTSEPTETMTIAKTTNESNIIKLDKIIAMKHEQSAEQPTENETTSRFATLKDLTKYINDNTMMLYDILDNTEQQYAEGTITLEEYSRIYGEAKDKLAELSTLLTSNESVYQSEKQESDYDILIDNINTINDTF